MTEKSEALIKDFHKKFAIEAFNETWQYIEMSNRSEEDDLKMIRLAHTSRFHWDFVGHALHFERGEWLIARVYTELEIFDRALVHGEKCLSICMEHKIFDFDLAFAYEGLTRTYKNKGTLDKFKHYYELALKASNEIVDPEDQDYFLSELKQLSS